MTADARKNVKRLLARFESRETLAAAISCAVMLLVAVSFAKPIPHQIYFLFTELYDYQSWTPYRLFAAAEDMCTVMGFLSLAGLFGESARTESVFPPHAAKYLGGSSLFFLMQVLLQTIGRSTILVMRKPPSMAQDPFFDPMAFGLGVFCLCLSFVFHYGRMVKEDSDDII